VSNAGHRGSIGKHIPRREDPYLLRGEGRFIDDVPEPRDLLFLGFVMSPHAHAEILSIDPSAAIELDGVEHVFTAADLAGLARPLKADIEIEGYISNERPILAESQVRFVGEHVAVVVARDPYVAQDAIDLVYVEYEDLEATVRLETASEPDAVLVHDDVPNNLIFEGHFSSDGFDEAFGSQKTIVRETFRTGRVAGVPMEPRGCVAIPGLASGTLTFYSSTQIPHMLRTSLAQILDHPESSIRVVTPDVGGGFGTKAHIYTEEVTAAAIALHLRRPIKWIQDRREDLLTSSQGRDQIYTLEAAVEPDGRIVAIRADVASNVGAYSSLPFGCTLESTGGARMLIGPYDIEHYAYRTRSLMTHTCPLCAYRGVAQPSCFMAIEGLMDRIGRQLGLDPALVRLKNVIKPEQIPYTNVLGVYYDSGSHEACLKRGLELSDYWNFRQQQKQNVDPDYLHGVGICCFTEVSGAGSLGWRVRGLTKMPGFDSATIKIEPTGTVTVQTSQAAAGQGHYTTFAQIVADYLGVRLEDVVVDEGDTANAPYGSNTLASRSAVAAGGAIIKTVGPLKEKLLQIASVLLATDPESIDLADSRAFVRDIADKSVSFEEIAQVAYSMTSVGLPQGSEFGLQATGFYDPPPATWPNGVHVAQVRVDRTTGEVHIDRYTIVHDCGTVINPMIVDGQVHGGTVQGLGEALMEQVVYDDEGQMLNANLLDYQLPTPMDVPDIEIDHISTPSVDNLGGFKGVGEGGVIGAVPAITNAVADAMRQIGVNVNRLPLRPSALARGHLDPHSPDDPVIQ
jgi:carbon-monoxide dehydrogenase large subunit